MSIVSLAIRGDISISLTCWRLETIDTLNAHILNALSKSSRLGSMPKTLKALSHAQQLKGAGDPSSCFIRQRTLRRYKIPLYMDSLARITIKMRSERQYRIYVRINSWYHFPVPKRTVTTKQAKTMQRRMEFK